MIEQYCDINSEVLINYLSCIDENYYGFNRIKKLFLNVKNSIYFDPFSSLQKASETLVMGKGNNFDKIILLHTLLIADGFDSKIHLCYVKDRTKRIISRSDKTLQWYFVEVNYFGRIINLDSTFDMEFMRAAGISVKDAFNDFSINKYRIDDDILFDVLKDPVQLNNDNANYRLLNPLTV